MVRIRLLRSMMLRHLEMAIERGEPIAGLWASESAIYGRFGFGQAVDAHEISIDARLTSVPPGPDDVTLALTGQLPFVILAGAIAAYPVALGLLALYRRRVLGYMARRAAPTGGDSAVSGPPPVAPPQAVDCVLTELGAGPSATGPLRDARRRSARLARTIPPGPIRERPANGAPEHRFCRAAPCCAA